jgi:uncharacterized protein
MSNTTTALGPAPGQEEAPGLDVGDRPETVDDSASEHPPVGLPVFERFEKVCDTLSAFEGLLGTAYADGWLCAVAASRRVIPTAEWLPLLTGEAFERAYADPEAVGEATAALEAWLDLRREDLDPEALLGDTDAVRLSPLFDVWTDEDRALAAQTHAKSGAETPDAVPDEGSDETPAVTGADAFEALQTGSMWASGFLDAVEAFADDWPDPLPSDDSPDAESYRLTFELLTYLTLPPSTPSFQAFLAAQWEGGTPSRDELLDEAVFAVQDLRLYWLDHAAKPEQRIVPEKVGRNDTCPCGSGKKFKKCHGAG